MHYGGHTCGSFPKISTSNKKKLRIDPNKIKKGIFYWNEGVENVVCMSGLGVCWCDFCTINIPILNWMNFATVLNHILFFIFVSSIITMLRQSKQQRRCSSPPWCTKLGLDVLLIKITTSYDFLNAIPRNKYTRSTYETSAILSTPPTAQKFAVVFVHSLFVIFPPKVAPL